MGNLPGYRTVTLYVEPELYEKVRQSAAILGEDIYEFVGEALTNAVDRRMSKKDRVAIEHIAKQHVANGTNRSKRR